MNNIGVLFAAKYIPRWLHRENMQQRKSYVGRQRRQIGFLLPATTRKRKNLSTMMSSLSTNYHQIRRPNYYRDDVYHSPLSYLLHNGNLQVRKSLTIR